MQANPLAEQLFQDGRALVDKGDHEGACAKFEASLRLDPRAVGTLLNIAMCKEATGKLATAWGLYREVATRSRGTRQDRVDLADKREKDLAPRLSTLAIEVPRNPPKEMTLRVDGLALEHGAWSSALPVDPGEHVVEARAPGHMPASVRVVVTGERQRVPVVVPSLAVEPPAAVAVGPVTQEEPPSKATRNLGIVLTVGGVAALGVGGYLGVDVLSRKDSPKDICPEPCVRGSNAAEESQARYDALGRQAVVTNVLLPVGGVLTLAGVYLWLLAPSSSKPKPSRAELVVTQGGAGIRGTF